MDDRLKPCPFCGSGNVEKTVKNTWGVSHYSRSRIECRNCGLKTRLFYSYEKEVVEEYWNRRANNG